MHVYMLQTQLRIGGLLNKKNYELSKPMGPITLAYDGGEAV